MEIGSICKIVESENPAGYPCIPLESQPLSADSPLVRGVLDPHLHLLMQLLCGFDLRRMWDRLNSGKQPVYCGYQFPKWGFAVVPVFESQVGCAANPIDEVFGHALSLVRLHPTLPLASREIGAAHRFDRGMSQDLVGPRTTRPPIEGA
jgi:hypothetical protein